MLGVTKIHARFGLRTLTHKMGVRGAFARNNMHLINAHFALTHTQNVRDFMVQNMKAKQYIGNIDASNVLTHFFTPKGGEKTCVRFFLPDTLGLFGNGFLNITTRKEYAVKLRPKIIVELDPSDGGVTHCTILAGTTTTGRFASAGRRFSGNWANCLGPSTAPSTNWKRLFNFHCQ